MLKTSHTLERWERAWPSKNCSYNINMRRNEAKYNRELLRVHKENKSLERGYKHNVRKLNAAQRGIISLLGHRPYHQIDRDEVLFEYNQPGFCYKRNGEPRKFCSLLESRTRRIVHDLDGKEGLIKKPASNIISDSPIMAEILSSPNLVEILCDLRTTAVLISDPTLFDQFANTLMKSPNNPLPKDGGNPMQCLVQYRNNLIQEFFDALRIQMEIRRCSEKTSVPSLNYYLNIQNEQGSSKTPLDEVLGTHFTPGNNKEWSEAVIKRLQAAKLEEDMRNDRENSNKNPTSESSILDSLLPFTMLINPEDNLKITASNAIDISPSSLKGGGPPANTAEQLTAIETSMAVNLISDQTTTDEKFTPALSWDHRQVITGQSHPHHKTRRNEFDRFVKNLVIEVEKIAEIGKNMGQFQKKKQKSDMVNKPLVRLLRKKSLFSSLTEDDLLFYEYDGGRRDAENIMARGLNLNQPRQGGFTFHVPSRNFTDSNDYNMTDIDDSFRSRPTTSTNNKNNNSSSSNYNESNNNNNNRPGSSKSVRVSTVPTNQTNSSKSRRISVGCEHENCHTQRSLKRLCCAACNAKIRAQCDEAQERDRKDRMTTDQINWKLPGLSRGWTRNSKKDTKAQHLLASIPQTLRRNYSRSSPGFVSSVSLSNFTESMSPQGRHGVPTPAGQRKNLLPEVSKFISKFQEPPTSSSRGGASSKSVTYRGTPAVKNSSSSGGGGGRSSTISKSRTETDTLRVSGRKPGAIMVAAQDEDIDFDSWTLKVDRMDIMKLRHELEMEVMREKVSQFETYLNPPTTSLI